MIYCSMLELTNEFGCSVYLIRILLIELIFDLSYLSSCLEVPEGMTLLAKNIYIYMEIKLFLLQIILQVERLTLIHRSLVPDLLYVLLKYSSLLIISMLNKR